MMKTKTILFSIVSLIVIQCSNEPSKEKESRASENKLITQILSEEVIIDSVYNDTIKYQHLIVFHEDVPEIIKEKKTYRITTNNNDTTLLGWYEQFDDSGRIRNRTSYILGKKIGWSWDYGPDSLVDYQTEYQIINGIDGPSVKQRWVKFDSLENIDFDESFVYVIKDIVDSNENFGNKLNFQLNFDSAIYKNNLQMVINNYDGYFGLIDSSNYQLINIDSKDQVYSVIPQLDKYGNKVARGYIIYGDRKLYFETGNKSE